MFQAQNWETINNTWKAAVCFKIIIIIIIVIVYYAEAAQYTAAIEQTKNTIHRLGLQNRNFSTVTCSINNTRPCFTTQHQTCKTETKTKTDFFGLTAVVLKSMISDHITADNNNNNNNVFVVYNPVLVA